MSDDGTKRRRKRQRDVYEEDELESIENGWNFVLSLSMADTQAYKESEMCSIWRSVLSLSILVNA